MKSNYYITKIDVVACFIIAIFILWKISLKNTVVILPDEFGYWSNAVRIVGINWMPTIAQTPRYAIGYSLTLAPLLFLFGKEGYSAVHVISVLLNGIYIATMYFIAKNVARKLFNKISVHYCSICALVSTVLCANLVRAQYGVSECFNSLLMWISVAILVSLEENDALYKEVILGVIVSWMYLTHNRCLAVYLSLIVTYLLKAFLSRRRRAVLLFACWIVLFIITYICDRQIAAWQVNEFSGINAWQGINTISNSSVKDVLSTPIQIIIESLLSKVFVVIITTGFVFFIYLYGYFQRVKRVIREKNKAMSYIAVHDYIFLTLLFAIIAQSLVAIAGRADRPVYSRYMDYAIGPAILIGFCQLKEYKAQKKMLLVQVPFVYIGAILARSNQTSSFFSIENSALIGSFYHLFGNSLRFPWETILRLHSLVFVAIMLLLFVFYERNRLCGEWTWCITAIAINVIAAGLSVNSSYDTYDYIHTQIDEIHRHIEDNADVIGNVCFLPTGNMTTDVNIMSLQFMLGDKYTIEWVKNAEEIRDLEGALIITSPKIGDTHKFFLDTGVRTDSLECYTLSPYNAN